MIQQQFIESLKTAFANVVNRLKALESKEYIATSGNAATSTITQGVTSYTVAGLPAGTAGQLAYASNGRKVGEGAGAGTGVLVYKDATNWRTCDASTTVAS